MILRCSRWTAYSTATEQAFLVLSGEHNPIPVSSLRACRTCGYLTPALRNLQLQLDDGTFRCLSSFCAAERPSVDISQLIGLALGELSNLPEKPES